jgi:hypothetical protein
MAAPGSTNGAAPLPPNVNLTKAKVLKKKHDWSWEDEMLMYDVSHRDFVKKRRLDNKEELKQVNCRCVQMSHKKNISFRYNFVTQEMPYTDIRKRQNLR